MTVRSDIAKLGSGWSPPMLWYAKAVRAMLAKPIADRTSWLALAAIHGCDLAGWRAQGLIGPGNLPPVAPEWNQCAHVSWYFLPWHRAYLASFEAIVAHTIVQLGGPEDWALPYWNYLDNTAAQARSLPFVFRTPTLPDGSPNPLAQSPRQYQVLAPHPPGIPTDISLTAMGVHQFTSAGAPGFGGSVNGAGTLERNPHNLVHIMIGGVTGTTGFMSDPDYAALDPIFWLHHCNIDRLWAAWLTDPANIQENGPAWRAGPAAPPYRLPDVNGQLASFKPWETLPGQRLAPSYDDLYKGTGLAPPTAAAALGATMPAQLSDQSPPAANLVGATVTNANIAPGAVAKAALPVEQLTQSLALSAPKLFLKIENIRGAAPSGMLTIALAVKPGIAASIPDREEFIESLPLFGLKKASDPDGPHGGNGLEFIVDITDAVNLLTDGEPVTPSDLEVSISQPGPEDGAQPIQVGRISVYSQ